jgi:hypothetical protein
MLMLLSAHAQTDSTHKKKPVPAHLKLVPNRTKLELVYKEALVTQYNSNGGSRSYNVFQPYVRVNDAKPVAIGKHADFLRSFFSRCEEADQQIDLMNQQIRRARLDLLGGVLIGAPVAFSGLFSGGSSSSSPSAAKFYSHFIAGAVIAGAGAYLAHMHAKRADEHLRLSVDIYNSRCFKPLPSDTARPQPAKTPANETPVIPSEMKIYHDTTLFKLLRNDPSNSGLFGLTLIPFVGNISSLNINFSGGAGIFYTYKSKYGISATYQKAYIDDLGGNNRSDAPVGDADSHGVPANYSKSSLLDLQAKITEISWEKEGYYHLKLGRTKIAGMPAEVIGRTQGTILRAITGRFGYMLDNRLVESNSAGIKYINSTPVYNYHVGDHIYPLTPNNLLSSATMVKAGIITAGIGYSSFRDIKIQLFDDTYTGRREEKAQTDVFFDLMYAQSLKVEDMIYYHALEPVTGEFEHLPQRLNLSNTPVSKLGVRAGFHTLSMYSPFFGISTQAEVGMRPGPQTIQSNERFYFQLGFGLVFGGRIALK